MEYIDVPYNEKNSAKALGAKWNPDEKKWYIEDTKTEAFDRWRRLPTYNLLANINDGGMIAECNGRHKIIYKVGLGIIHILTIVNSGSKCPVCNYETLLHVFDDKNDISSVCCNCCNANDYIRECRSTARLEYIETNKDRQKRYISFEKLIDNYKQFTPTLHRVYDISNAQVPLPENTELYDTYKENWDEDRTLNPFTKRRIMPQKGTYDKVYSRLSSYDKFHKDQEYKLNQTLQHIVRYNRTYKFGNYTIMNSSRSIYTNRCNVCNGIPCMNMVCYVNRYIMNDVLYYICDCGNKVIINHRVYNELENVKYLYKELHIVFYKYPVVIVDMILEFVGDKRWIKF